MKISISILRVILTVYIVFYHCFCYYGVWRLFPDSPVCNYIHYLEAVKNVILNAFVIVSGYLYSYNFYVKGKYLERMIFIINKSKHIGIPYVVWGMVLIMLFPQYHSFSDLIHGISHLWFLPMLLFVSIFSRIIIKFLRTRVLKNIIIVTGVFLLGAITNRYIPDNMTLLSLVIHYITPFILGVVAFKDKWIEKLCNCTKKYRLMLTVCSLSSFVCVVSFDNLPLGSLYYDIPGYILVLLILSYLENLKIKHIPDCVLSVDCCSYGIYIIHHILIWIILVYIPYVHYFMNDFLPFAPISLFAIVFILSWGGTYIMKKNEVTAFLIGG